MNRTIRRTLLALSVVAAISVLRVDPQRAALAFGPPAAHANIFSDVADALKKVGELTAKIAQYTTGEMARIISAFRQGPHGLLRYVIEKLPGPLAAPAKIVEAMVFGGGSLVDRLKRAGEALLDELKSIINSVKNAITSGIDKVVKPLLAQVQQFINDKVLTPAISGLTSFLGGQLDSVIAKVAGAILGKTDRLQKQADGLLGALDAVASGDMSAVNAQLAAFNTNIDTIGQDAVNMALDLGLNWLRGKVVAFVMKGVDKLMQMVWKWAYQGVAAARNAVQGLVGSVPFAGGVLAGVVGVLIDQGWELLKGKVNEFIEGQVNRLADMAMGKAKELLSGVAGSVGGALQGLVNALRGPLQTIAQKVKEKIEPIVGKYRAVVVALQKLRDKRARK
jgi:hypothetical protein